MIHYFKHLAARVGHWFQEPSGASHPAREYERSMKELEQLIREVNASADELLWKQVLQELKREGYV